MSGRFRFTKWDPVLIIAQMVALQSLFYVSLCSCMALTNFIAGENYSVSQLFTYQVAFIWNLRSRCVVAAYIITSLVGALGLWYFVQRAKLCLDFSTTTHFFHLLCCWAYNGTFPNTLSWWVLNTVGATITCICGEFLCMKVEMKDIARHLVPEVDL
ncbi:protein SYS1 homolog isoform X2 [Ornithodoros turicata]